MSIRFSKTTASFAAVFSLLVGFSGQSLSAQETGGSRGPVAASGFVVQQRSASESEHGPIGVWEGKGQLSASPFKVHVEFLESGIYRFRIDHLVTETDEEGLIQDELTGRWGMVRGNLVVDDHLNGVLMPGPAQLWFSSESGQLKMSDVFANEPGFQLRRVASPTDNSSLWPAAESTLRPDELTGLWFASGQIGESRMQFRLYLQKDGDASREVYIFQDGVLTNLMQDACVWHCVDGCLVLDTGTTKTNMPCLLKNGELCLDGISPLGIALRMGREPEDGAVFQAQDSPPAANDPSQADCKRER